MLPPFNEGPCGMEVLWTYERKRGWCVSAEEGEVVVVTDPFVPAPQAPVPESCCMDDGMPVSLAMEGVGFFSRDLTCAEGLGQPPSGRTAR